jgi:putative ABC transport system ATP-binding protein
VFQSFHLIPTMTALENVAVPLELAGNPDAAKRAEQELTSVGLGDRLHHYPTQLSGGEQQRVALARALAPDPARRPASRSSTCSSPSIPSAA